MSTTPNTPKSPARCGRTVRIVVLVGVVATLSLADLWLTVYFMSTTGMSELNPLARALAGFGPSALVAFKLASLLVNGGVLVACRTRVTAELGAWVSVIVMVALTAHWHNYMNATHELTNLDPATLATDVNFVKIAG
jgi:hypothetical protein